MDPIFCKQNFDQDFFQPKNSTEAGLWRSLWIICGLHSLGRTLVVALAAAAVAADLALCPAVPGLAPSGALPLAGGAAASAAPSPGAAEHLVC